LLRTRGEELLAEGHAAGYEHTLATVWELSQQILSEASPAAMQLLRLCAFLGPEPIPLALFTENPGLLPAELADAARDELRFERTLAALLRRSPARRSLDGSPDGSRPRPRLSIVDGTALTVHRLLAAVVRRIDERHRPRSSSMTQVSDSRPAQVSGSW
jgi:hypothetical protein